MQKGASHWQELALPNKDTLSLGPFGGDQDLEHLENMYVVWVLMAFFRI